MFMKRHILAALREEFNSWEALLGSLNEARITTPQPPSPWSIKDDLAHVWAWQQRSIARLEAARCDQEPVYPAWPESLDPDTEAATAQINDWIYATNRDLAWPVVYQRWRDGFLHFLEAAEAISEKDLLDSSRYPWLHGFSLANVLLASYDHHQEHLDNVQKGFS